jgi:SAM-dependent methyltransferase
MHIKGFCPVCFSEVEFIAIGEWLRDNLYCSICKSLPRERALFHVLRNYFPKWKEYAIHESSPDWRGASLQLRKECSKYKPSHYFTGYRLGDEVNGFANENLEHLTFADNFFDLHITQDVLEHVLDPKRAFAELARTLKPGGAHIFTVPLVNGFSPSVVRAQLKDGLVFKHLPDVFHGNPIDSGGALVTVDWGFDICSEILRSSGMFTVIHSIQDSSLGILGAYTEVLVSWKGE